MKKCSYYGLRKFTEDPDVKVYHIAGIQSVLQVGERESIAPWRKKNVPTVYLRCITVLCLCMKFLRDDERAGTNTGAWSCSGCLGMGKPPRTMETI